MAYYIANKGVQQGPYDLKDLPRHGLREDSLVWTEGMSDWQRADGVAEVRALLAPQPQPPAEEPAPVEQQAPAEQQAAGSEQPVPVTVISPYPQQPNQPLGYRTSVNSQGNGMAVASLVLGIVAFPVNCAYVGPVCSILAVIFGFIARAKVQRQETEAGAGMALAGIILGFINLALTIIGIALIVIFFVAHSAGGRF